MRALSLTLLMMTAALHVGAAECPFGIPIKTLAPHTVNGYSWGNVIRPQGDACISHIALEPGLNPVWYAGSFYGLYVSNNNGVTWTKPLNGQVGTLLVWPGNASTPPLVYAGIGNRLWLSRDHGVNWVVIATFSTTVRSLLVSEGRLYIGLHWGNHIDPSGVYISNLGGGGMVFKPFGPGHTGLIVWTISRDEQNDILYAGTEIFDHPQPYKPPFFRSANEGTNWSNVNAFGALPWHVVDSDVRPGDNYLYALTEGYGVYGSANMGSTWSPPTFSPGLGLAMLMDSQLPTRLYVGRHEFGTLNGGLFRSNDSGKTYFNIGLLDVTVADVTLNSSGSRIYAATYGSGIYVANVP